VGPCKIGQDQAKSKDIWRGQSKGSNIPDCCSSWKERGFEGVALKTNKLMMPPADYGQESENTVFGLFVIHIL
jgi:hypothetical protein